jgi:hypothetical protein
MREQLDILADAISDVGRWRWWVAELPQLFQLEFSGTQLWTPPLKEGAPPCGQLALRFIEPVAVCFLSFAEMPDDWPAQMHADQLEPFNVDDDAFRFDDAALAAELLAAGKKQTLHGDPAALAPHCLAFRAGAVGCVVSAREIRLVSHQGELPLDEVHDRSTRWWSYWREYWARRGGDQPLPEDYACEVTIPVK